MRGRTISMCFETMDYNNDRFQSTNKINVGIYFPHRTEFERSNRKNTPFSMAKGNTNIILLLIRIIMVFDTQNSNIWFSQNEIIIKWSFLISIARNRIFMLKTFILTFQLFMPCIQPLRSMWKPHFVVGEGVSKSHNSLHDSQVANAKISFSMVHFIYANEMKRSS